MANWRIEIDEGGLAFVAQKTLERLAHQFAEDPDDIARLQALAQIAAALTLLLFSVNLYAVQNIYWRALQDVYPVFLASAGSGDDDAASWVETFRKLGETCLFASTTQ